MLFTTNKKNQNKLLGYNSKYNFIPEIINYRFFSLIDLSSNLRIHWTWYINSRICL